MPIPVYPEIPPKGYEVILTWPEVWRAVQIGVIRQYNNLMVGRQDYAGCPDNQGWQVHIEGALGEMAVAKFLRLPWDGNIERLSLPDVADLQVRTTRRLNGVLIIYPKDCPNDIFILVVGKHNTFRVVGWTYARHAKVERFKNVLTIGRPMCFCVPQFKLRDVQDLPGLKGQNLG